MAARHDVRIPILGLGCASEASSLERRLARLPGTRCIYVNPVTETVYAEVDGPEAEARLHAALEEAGYRSYVSRPTRRIETRQKS